MSPPTKANPRVAAGVSQDTSATTGRRNHIASSGRIHLLPSPTAACAPANLKTLRVGSLFLNDLTALLDRLSPAEFHALWRFRVECVYAAGSGLVDDDKALARAVGYKGWPALKAKLILWGFAAVEDGILRDPDLDESIKRQRATSERQRDAALKRWSGRQP